MTRPRFTEEDIPLLNERDDLAMREVKGEPMTPEELKRLGELNRWLDSFDEPSPGLPPEVREIVNKVLGN